MNVSLPADGVPHPDADILLRAWEAGGWEPGTRLPSHLPGCYGCGADNPHGIGLVVDAGDDGAVVSHHTFDQRFQGAIGVAHGGATAAAFDDLFGFVLVRILVPAVTRELTVRYRRPVRLDEECRLTARCDHREDRELHLSAELHQRGRVAAEADAVFVEVDPQRLMNPPRD